MQICRTSLSIRPTNQNQGSESVQKIANDCRPLLQRPYLFEFVFSVFWRPLRTRRRYLAKGKHGHSNLEISGCWAFGKDVNPKASKDWFPSPSGCEHGKDWCWKVSCCAGASLGPVGCHFENLPRRPLQKYEISPVRFGAVLRSKSPRSVEPIVKVYWGSMLRVIWRVHRPLPIFAQRLKLADLS